MTEVTITQAERDALYFMPPAVGGKTPSEEIQQQLEDKCLVRRHSDGRRLLTILGDKVQRQSSTIKVTVHG